MGFDFGQAIGVLANLCVIAGIIFLAIEIRQNNKMQAAQARYSLRQYRNDIADTLMSPDVLRAAHKMANNETVSSIEKSVADLAALKTIELWEWQYGEYLEGMLKFESLPIGAWRLWFWNRGATTLPFSDAWDFRKHVMNPAFVSFFEEKIIKEGRAIYIDGEQEKEA